METNWIIKKMTEWDEKENKEDDKLMINKMANPYSLNAEVTTYDRNYFKEKCKNWRLRKEEQDIYYINMKGLNVFDSFRIRSNESHKVTSVYHETGMYYKIMPPQLMPLYRYAVREIYKGNSPAFNIKVLQVIIDVTTSVHQKDDYSGYCVLKHAFRDCALKFITMNGWAASIVDGCRIWSYIDDLETEDCNVDIVFEHVMDMLKKFMEEKLATL